MWLARVQFAPILFLKIQTTHICRIFLRIPPNYQQKSNNQFVHLNSCNFECLDLQKKIENVLVDN